MSLLKVQNVIDKAIAASRLANSVFSTQVIENRIIVYRIVDDIVLDDIGCILREHIVLGVTTDETGWEEKFYHIINDWAFRYGVGSITLFYCGKINPQMMDLAKKLRIYLIDLESSVDNKREKFILPFNSRDQYTDFVTLDSQIDNSGAGTELGIDVNLEIFKFLVKVYLDEEPIIDHELSYEERKWFLSLLRNVSSSDGAYHVDKYSNNGIRVFYYRYWRLGIEQKREQAIYLNQQFKSEERMQRGWSIILFSKMLGLVIRYFDELLLGVNTLKIVEQLKIVFNDLRAPDSVKPVIEQWNLSSLLNTLSLIETLGNLRASGAIHYLFEMLGSPEKEIRRWAVKAVSRIREPTVIYLLKRALGDQNNLVRQATIDGLATIGGDLAARALSSYYAQARPEEYSTVLYAVARTKSQIAFDTLLDFMLSDNPETTSFAHWPMKEFLKDLSNIIAIRSRWASIPEVYRMQIATRLADRINRREDIRTVEVCIEVAAALREILTVPSIALILHNLDEGLEYEAAKALGEIGGPESEKALITALRIRGKSVHRAVIEAIGKLKVREAVSLLLELLRDGKHTRDVIKALGAIQVMDAVEDIEKAVLKDKNLAPVAVEALINIGARDVASQIEQSYPRKQKQHSLRDNTVIRRMPDGQEITEIDLKQQ